MLEQVLQHLNNWFWCLMASTPESSQCRTAALRCPSCKQGSISGWWGLSLMTGFINTQHRTWLRKHLMALFGRLRCQKRWFP